MLSPTEQLFLDIEQDNQGIKPPSGADLAIPHPETQLPPIAHAAFLGRWKVLSTILESVSSYYYDFVTDSYQLGTALLTLIAYVPNLQDPDIKTCFQLLMSKHAHMIPAIWAIPQTPIWGAVMNNNSDILDLLLKEKALPYTPQPQHRLHSPVLLAANKGYWRLIPTLVNDRENSPGDYEQYGFTLEKAILAGEYGAVSCLINSGKHIAQKHKDNALFLATKKIVQKNNSYVTQNDFNILTQLIDTQADLTSRQHGQTVIMMLAEKKSYTVIHRLIKHIQQGNPNCFYDGEDSIGLDYALMAAVSSYMLGYLHYQDTKLCNLIKSLVAIGANPTSLDARDDAGNTAFHHILRYRTDKYGALYSDTLFPILYSSPKLDRLQKNIDNQLPIQVIAKDQYTKLVADYLTPRLMLLIIASHQSRYDNQPNPFGSLPFETLDLIMQMMILAQPLRETIPNPLPLFMHNDKMRYHVRTLKDELNRKNLTKTMPKAMHNLIDQLSVEHSAIGIQTVIDDFFNNVYSNGEHQHPDTSFIKQFLEQNQLANTYYWSQLNTDFHIKIRDQVINFLAQFEHSPESRAMKKTCPITKKFIEELPGLKTKETIDECVETFLKTIHLTNQHQKKSIGIIFGQLVNAGLTTEVHLQEVKTALKADIVYRKRTVAFLKATLPSGCSDMAKPFVQELSNAVYASNIIKLVKQLVYKIYSSGKENQSDNKQIINLLKTHKLITEDQLQKVITSSGPNVMARKQVQAFIDSYSKLSRINLTSIFNGIKLDKKTKTLVAFLKNLGEMTSAKKIHKACVDFIGSNIYQHGTQETNKPLIGLFEKHGLISQEDIKKLDEKYSIQVGDEAWELVS